MFDVGRAGLGDDIVIGENVDMFSSLFFLFAKQQTYTTGEWAGEQNGAIQIKQSRNRTFE